MEETLKCMNCPFRCDIDVDYDEHILFKIDGNSCPRGEKYIEDKLKIKEKYFVSYLNVLNGKAAKVKVSSTKPVPIELHNDLEKKMAAIKVNAPIKLNQLLIENLLDGVQIRAAENME